MTTPAPGPLAAPALADSDQRCSTQELLDAWIGIIRGYEHVNRILACQVEIEIDESDGAIAKGEVSPAGMIAAGGSGPG